MLINDFLKNLGKTVRKRRKNSGLTQAEAAALCGIGTRFLSELENGKQSLQIGKVLQVLSGLGLVLEIKPKGRP